MPSLSLHWSPTALPVRLEGKSVTMIGPLTASTIAPIRAAADLLDDDSAEDVTVDLREVPSDYAVLPIEAAARPDGPGCDDRLVRLPLPILKPV